MGHNQRKLLKAQNAINVLRLFSVSNFAGGSGSWIPTNVAAGDLIVVFQITANLETTVSLAGWDVYGTDLTAYATHGYKVSDGTEGGTYVKFSGAAAPTRSYVTLFRSSKDPLTAASAVDRDIATPVGSPAAQVKNCTTLGTAPMFVYALYGMPDAAPSGETWSGSDYTVENSLIYTHSFFHQFSAGGTVTDVTVNLGDGGSRNILASQILNLTF